LLNGLYRVRQVLTDRKKGEVSQTLQIAPYDEDWKFNNASSDVANPDLTYWNSYTGGVYQQSCSGLTIIPDDVYQETGGVYTTYGYELYANKDDRSNGYITWVADGVESWTLHAPGLAPNAATQVGQRLIPEEPMALVLNFGLSDNFQWVDKEHLKFPAEMQFEYVRVYQREDYGSVGCDPKGTSERGAHHVFQADRYPLILTDYPTADYIARHAEGERVNDESPGQGFRSLIAYCRINKNSLQQPESDNMGADWLHGSQKQAQRWMLITQQKGWQQR